jgi:hypothetical protein
MYAGALGRALLSTLLLPRRADALALGLHRTLVVALGLLLLIRAAAARAQAQRHKHAQRRIVVRMAYSIEKV